MPFVWTDAAGRPGRAITWRNNTPSALVVAVHGLSGAAEQFEPVAAALPGVSVYALELAGQGWDPDPRCRGTCLDVERQLQNLDHFIAAAVTDCPGSPVFLLGESMGALLVARYAATRPDSPVRGVIHSVPVVGLRREVPGPIRTAVRWLGTLAPQLRTPPSVFVHGKTTSPPLTRNRAYQDSLHQKPHRINAFTFRFLSELGDLIASSPAVAAQIRHPTLTLAAGFDCFVRVEQIQAWHDLIPTSEKTLRVYPDAYHLLWHDWDRDRVLEDVRDWIARRGGGIC